MLLCLQLCRLLLCLQLCRLLLRLQLCRLLLCLLRHLLRRLLRLRRLSLLLHHGLLDALRGLLGLESSLGKLVSDARAACGSRRRSRQHNRRLLLFFGEHFLTLQHRPEVSQGATCFLGI